MTVQAWSEVGDRWAKDMYWLVLGSKGHSWSSRVKLPACRFLTPNCPYGPSEVLPVRISLPPAPHHSPRPGFYPSFLIQPISLSCSIKSLSFHDTVLHTSASLTFEPSSPQYPFLFLTVPFLLQPPLHPAPISQLPLLSLPHSVDLDPPQPAPQSDQWPGRVSCDSAPTRLVAHDLLTTASETGTP